MQVSLEQQNIMTTRRVTLHWLWQNFLRKVHLSRVEKPYSLCLTLIQCSLCYFNLICPTLRKILAVSFWRNLSSNLRKPCFVDSSCISGRAVKASSWFDGGSRTAACWKPAPSGYIIYKNPRNTGNVGSIQGYVPHVTQEGHFISRGRSLFFSLLHVSLWSASFVA